MARILPDGWTALAETGAAPRERETLARLARGLPAGYTVYHGVHWTRLDRGSAIFGTVDFAIVNRQGDLLLVEQKNGLLQESPEGLLKHDGRGRQQVAVALAATRDALASRIHARPGCSDLTIDTLLYCPDHHVREPRVAGLAPERIVDAQRADQLAALIRAILPAGEERPAAAQVHRFLQNLIELQPDVSALIGQAEALVTRLAGGLAEWAGRLEMDDFRLRVLGTAGSGKSQLALAEFKACLERGGRPLYLCFNRPLADHFRRIAPGGGTSASFHQWCDARLRARGLSWDPTAAEAFSDLAERACALPLEDDERFDTVIVDEGQDFDARWAHVALAAARPGGRRLWLEDPMQNLYDRPNLALPGWVRLRTTANYRSPRRIVQLLNALLAAVGETWAIDAHAPMAGEPVVRLVYEDAASQPARLREALRLCWSAGFRNEDIVLLSFHGREQASLLRSARLGTQALRTFRGSYDLFGNAHYSEGELLAESVLRFKGQSAPAVILHDIDFQTLDRRALGRLFVGATRARMKLVLVLSAAAAKAWPAPADRVDRFAE